MSKKRRNAKYVFKPATAAEMFKSLKISKKKQKQVAQFVKWVSGTGFNPYYPQTWLGFEYIPTGTIYEAVGFNDYHILTISPNGFFKGKVWECYNRETHKPLTRSAEAFAAIVMSGAPGSGKVK